MVIPDPNIPSPTDKRRRGTPRDRFFAKISMEVGGCWTWIAQLNTQGYATFKYLGKPRGAHRVMWFWMTGEWPEVVQHLCNNPKCVNPIHLSGGTQIDNMQHCVKSGRHKSGYYLTEIPRDARGRFSHP